MNCFLKTLVLSVFAAGVLSQPSRAAEVIFKGTAIGLTKSFLCGSVQAPGAYDLLVSYEPKPHDRSLLTVSKGGKTLCEVEGSSSSDKLQTTKVRVFTKVNPELDAIQIDVFLPSAVRSGISNQVFYLPLSKD